MMLITRSIAANTTLIFTAADRWCSLQEILQQSQHFEIYCSWSMMLITRNITAMTTLWDLLQLVDDAHYRKHYSNHSTFEIHCSRSMMLITRSIAATATLWDLLQLVDDAHYKKYYSNHNTLRFTAAGRWCSLQETLQQSQHFEIYCSWSMMLTTRNIAATATFASKMSTWFQHSYTWWWYISQMKR